MWTPQYLPYGAELNRKYRDDAMADRSKHPIVHFVGSIPLPDSETVFRTLSKATGPHLIRLPDGETGIRKTWIRFLQDVLAGNSAIELAKDVPPFKFTQWDGKLVREIPRLRVKPGATIDPSTFDTGYAAMAIEFVGGVRAAAEGRRHSRRREIPDLDSDADRADLQQHGAGRPAEALAAADAAFHRRGARRSPRRCPTTASRIQWDVCQEVLAWEDYYDKGPVDFRTETIDVLTQIGDGVPAGIELGYHLCYGSPADEHMVLPKDMGIMVEIDQRDGRRRQAADPVLPYAGGQGAHRRRLFRAAQGPEAAARRPNCISA